MWTDTLGIGAFMPNLDCRRRNRKPAKTAESPESPTSNRAQEFLDIEQSAWDGIQERRSRTLVHPDIRAKLEGTMKQFAAVVLLAPLLSAFPSFYIGEQQYRFDRNDPRCLQDHMCTSEEHPGAGGHSYSLNFIEVRDNGKLFDDSQLEAARAQVRAARARGQQPTVFIYVHGWHNSAEEKSNKKGDCSDSLYNGDVQKFRKCGLEVLAYKSAPTIVGAPPRIVGIYLAWHGTDFAWPPFTIIPSYPFRRGAARHVGEIGMALALQRIFDVINEDRDAYFVIAMGHSFGARALEAAAEIIPDSNHPQSGILRKYRTGQQRVSGNTRVRRLPVDLIFYVNAATSHSITLKAIKDWHDRCNSPSPPAGCEKDPLYLAISSRADVLTALVMPIANAVFFSPRTDQYHLIAAANTPWLQTHKIPKPVDECPTNFPPNTFCFGIPESSTSTNYHRVDFKAGKTPAMFWAMNSDHWVASLEGMLHSIPVFRPLIARHWVILSHGDVWNTGVFNLVSAIINREERKTRDMVTKARSAE